MTPQSLNFAGTAVALAKPRITTKALTNDDTAEVISFLRERATHTVVMSSFILDHGIQSELNRGTFYAARDESNSVQGVALIGHATFIEARGDAVIRCFAGLAQQFPQIHMVLGEHKTVDEFWRVYAGAGQPLRQRHRETLFELNETPLDVEEVPELRLATLNDLRQVAAVQAYLAYEESGINPLLTDRTGFLDRCRRRIERNRVWTWILNDEVIFKADLISETPDAIYLEGIYVNPEERNRGVGRRCLTQLARNLLVRAKSIVVLVNENKTDAHRFFRRVGFVARSVYDTLFLERPSRNGVDAAPFGDPGEHHEPSTSEDPVHGFSYRGCDSRFAVLSDQPANRTVGRFVRSPVLSDHRD